MPRVIGIDPGTVSVDVCGLDDGRSSSIVRCRPPRRWRTHPCSSGLLEDAHRSAPLDLVAGPSGYGLPIVDARRLTDNDLRLAYLAADGEPGGIGGLRSLMRELARLPIPIVLTPGVVHLPTVPAHRKVNRVDMGTADKVCVAALAIREHARGTAARERDASFILARARRRVHGGAGHPGRRHCRWRGRIVRPDRRAGGGGTRRRGGVSRRHRVQTDAVLRRSRGDCRNAGRAGRGIGGPRTDRGRLAWEAYLESAVKAVVSLAVSAPRAREVIVSGRFARIASVRDELTRRLAGRGGAAGSAAGRLRRGRACKPRRGRRFWPTVLPAELRPPSWTLSAYATRRARCSIICMSSRRQPRGRGLDLPERPANRRVKPHVLVAGVSTRAAAESAARAGFRVTAIDAFGDLDQHPLGGRAHAGTKVLGARRRPGRAGHRVRHGRVPLEFREPPESRRHARPRPDAVGQYAGRAPACPRSARPRARAA